MDSKNFSLETRLYEEQEKLHRQTPGKKITVYHTDTLVVVYQAFCPEIADFAVKSGYFGGPKYRLDKKSWLKTSFMWMVNRSNWATLPGQERILAIYLHKYGFLEILNTAMRESELEGDPTADTTTLAWLNDINLDGDTSTRTVLQIGISGDMLLRTNDSLIDCIQDITEFVHQQHEVIKAGDMEKLMVPIEEVFVIEDEKLRAFVELGAHYTTTALPKLPVKGLKPNIRAVICLQGSFNPIHKKHVELLVEVKKWLEENTHYTVIAGVLALLSDKFLLKKFSTSNQLVINSKHRRAMCLISCKRYDWIRVHCLTALTTDELKNNLTQDIGRSFEMFLLYGADRAIKTLSSKNITHMISIGRKGSTEQLRDEYNIAVRDNHIDTKTNIIVPVELDNVSSTSIRYKLTQMAESHDIKEKRKLVEEMVNQGWIEEEIGQYIVKWESELYTST